MEGQRGGLRQVQVQEAKHTVELPQAPAPEAVEKIYEVPQVQVMEVPQVVEHEPQEIDKIVEVPLADVVKVVEVKQVPEVQVQEHDEQEDPMWALFRAARMCGDLESEAFAGEGLRTRGEL